MTNDSKLGMLAGVLGVVVAAVFFAKQPAQPVAAESQTTQVAPAASAPGAPPGVVPAALPSTPVARTRKDITAQPTSRQPVTDEEP